jgi:hypothetical protein
MKKSTKQGQRKGRPYTPKPKQATIIARHLSGQSDREITRQEGVSRGTVYRVRAQSENLMLVQSYREMILDLVPAAIKGLRKLIRKVDRQAIIETLYGTRVLIQRQEVEKVEEPVRTYAYTRAEFFGKYGRWPRNEELEEFDKTLKVDPIVNGELTE